MKNIECVVFEDQMKKERKNKRIKKDESYYSFKGTLFPPFDIRYSLFDIQRQRVYFLNLNLSFSENFRFLLIHIETDLFLW